MYLLRFPFVQKFEKNREISIFTTLGAPTTLMVTILDMHHKIFIINQERKNALFKIHLPLKGQNSRQTLTMIIKTRNLVPLPQKTLQKFQISKY